MRRAKCVARTPQKGARTTVRNCALVVLVPISYHRPANMSIERLKGHLNMRARAQSCMSIDRAGKQCATNAMSALSSLRQYISALLFAGDLSAARDLCLSRRLSTRRLVLAVSAKNVQYCSRRAAVVAPSKVHVKPALWRPATALPCQRLFSSSAGDTRLLDGRAQFANFPMRRSVLSLVRKRLYKGVLAMLSLFICARLLLYSSCALPTSSLIRCTIVLYDLIDVIKIERSAFMVLLCTDKLPRGHLSHFLMWTLCGADHFPTCIRGGGTASCRERAQAHRRLLICRCLITDGRWRSVLRRQRATLAFPRSVIAGDDRRAPFF